MSNFSNRLNRYFAWLVWMFFQLNFNFDCGTILIKTFVIAAICYCYCVYRIAHWIFFNNCHHDPSASHICCSINFMSSFKQKQWKYDVLAHCQFKLIALQWPGDGRKSKLAVMGMSQKQALKPGQTVPRGVPTPLYVPYLNM